MKEAFQKIIAEAINALKLEDLPIEAQSIELLSNKNPLFGHYSTNIALKKSKQYQLNPRQLAEKIKQQLQDNPQLAKIEIAGAGFINLFINQSVQFDIIKTILERTENYGQGANKHCQVLVEFVSANPTGPLHIGHGRGAVYGDTISRFLTFSGYQVDTEYYVNDAGRQIDILVLSVLFRYQQLFHSDGEKIIEYFPPKCYQGDYIFDIAKKLKQNHNLSIDFSIVQNSQIINKNHTEDDEKLLDKWIKLVQNSITTEFQIAKKLTIDIILGGIKKDLQDCNIVYKNWFSEQSLLDDKSVEQCISKLKQSSLVYQKENALWLKSSELGDDKDRVLIRSDGINTYFLHDIAYHINKYHRGYQKIINVWGADHHGYIARMNAAIEVLGYEKDKLIVKIVQFANLFREHKKISMTTRGGKFVTLKELSEEIGIDATRYFYNAFKIDQHMNFDLSLAVSKSNDNPIFYVQYAYARIQSIFSKLAERQLQWQSKNVDYSLLEQEIEQKIAKALAEFPNQVEKVSSQLLPNIMTNYLKELATLIHQYYNQTTIISEQESLRNTRLNLLQASAIVIKNALTLLGVSAPHKM